MTHVLRCTRRTLLMGLLLLPAAMWAADAADQIAASVRAWRERLVARSQGTPADLALHLLLPAAGVDKHQSDLRVTLWRHAGRWMPTVARTQSHRAERFTATFTAEQVDDERLTGRLAIVVIMPPAGTAGDHGVFTANAPRRRELVYLLDCRLEAAGQVSGRYRDAPEHPSRADRISGHWARAHTPRSLCRLLLPGAIAGRDLHLLAIADADALQVLEARTPHWNKARHRIGPMPVPAAGDGYTGTLELTLRSDGYVPADSEQVVCSLALRCIADPSTGSIHGEYAIESSQDAVPAARATLRGSVVPLAAEGVPAVPQRPADAAMPALRGWAESCYHYARSAEMALRTGLPFGACHVRTGVPGHAIRQPQIARDRLVAIARCIAAEPEAPPTGTTLPADPAFGPWYRQRAAACDDAGHHQLGPPGAWAHLSRWRILGPFRPQPFPRSLHPLLPPVVESDTAAYADSGDPMLPPATGALDQWRWQELTASDPVVDPNLQAHPAADGFAGRRYFASATVHAKQATQAWLALAGTTTHSKWGRGERAHLAAWLNDAPVWRSGAHTDELREHRAVIPIALEPGVNRILLAVESPGAEALGFSCHLYHGPPPRASAAVAAWDQQRRAHLDQQPAHGMTGFRGDLSGVFPNAEPVTAWDLEQEINVRWRVPLSSFSNATPVVLGDRVITLSEPHHIHCYATDDGTLLWHRTASPFDEMPTARAERLRHQAARHTELERTRKRLRRQIRDLRGKDASARVDALRAELERLKPALERARAAAEHGRIAKATWGAFMGQTFASPVSDGQHIWVKLGSGVIACFTTAGERIWQVTADVRPNVYQTSSPLLVDGLLIVRWMGEKAGGHHTKGDRFVAYEASTGAVRWRTVVPGRSAGGTTRPLRLSDGAQTLWVLVSPAGAILRCSDGRLLLPGRGLQASAGWTIVNADDDRLIYPMHHAQMASERLILADRDRVGARPLWQPIWWGGGSHHFFTGDYACLYAGRAYLNTVVKEHDLKHPCPWQVLNVVDCQTGALDLRLKPAFRQVAHCYTPPTIAGHHLFLVDSGDPASGCFPGRPGGPAAESAIAVFDLDNHTRPVAVNPMPRMQAPPAFALDAMFVRTHTELLCIGQTGAAGHAYAERERAHRLFDALRRYPPPAAHAVRGIAPVPWPENADALPTARLDAQAPAALLLAATDAAAPAAELARPVRKQAELGAGQLHPLAPTAYACKGGLRQVAVDFTAAFAANEARHGWIATNLVIARRQVVSCVNPSELPFVLAGQRVEDGELLRLQPGLYPLLVHAGFSRRPPPGVQIQVRFGLRAAEDPDRALARWREQVTAYAGDLRWVRQRFAETGLAFDARRLLDLLDAGD